MIEMLERNGIHSFEEHLIAVRSWGSVTFVAQKGPVGTTADSVRAWAHRLLFDPLVLPAVQPAERSRYNALQDTSLLRAVDSLLTGDRASLYGAYPFRISPTTDDRPYFSQFLKWRYLPALRAQFGQGRIPFLELGTITVALTWLQIAVIAVVLILLPLVRLARSSSGRARTLSYFGSLAVGFMFVELIMIQRFTLYLGHPVRAVAFVFAVLLICSGLGSIASARLHPRARDLHAIAGRVVIGLIALVVLLKPLLDLTIGLPMPLRLVAGTAVLGPVAFLMGFPFPLGLRVLDSASKSLVPWAWAVNGCLSVASAPAAVLLAAEGGATVVLAAAAASYAIAAITGRFPRQAPA